MACRTRAYSMYDGMIHTSRLSPCALRISAHRIDSLGVSDALLDQTAPLVVEPLEEGHHLLRGHREEQIAHRDDAYRVVAVDLAILERLAWEVRVSSLTASRQAAAKCGAGAQLSQLVAAE